MKEGRRWGLPAHAQIHPPEIRNQPHQPHKQAVTVEAGASLLATSAGCPCRPNGMCQHEPQGNLTCECVRLEQIERPCCHSVHGPRARDVKG